MLSCLRIRQLAIVSELDVEFGPGLNVISGETGAGKSILVSALKLVLGGRARPDMVRSGADQAEIEALFDVGDDAAFQGRWAALGLPADDELVIRRIIQSNGRSRAYVNGSLATANQLAELAAGLVDISSQHEHQTLVDASCHLGYLDAFAGHAAEVAEIGAIHTEVLGLVLALNGERARVSERTEREDLLRFQVGEIDRLAPKAGEEESVTVELSRLRHADRLGRVTAGAEQALYAGEPAVCDVLGRLAGEIDELSRLDAALTPFAERLDATRLEIEDLARELGRYSRTMDSDPGRLGELEERLHGLRRLMRKYGGTLEGVLEHRQRAAEELAGLDGAEARIEELEARVQEVCGRAGALAHKLSERRKAASIRLGKAITEELASLGMGGARVEVAVAPLEEGDAGPVVGGARLSATGIDRVEFLIAPNRGEDPRPIRRVASGGELSRSLLALKRVLSGLGPVGTYIFDEVDTGVGGAVAEVIGHKLREVARHHQVLCITHLPQVASLGDRHLRVKKEEVDGRTVSSILPLSREERVEEIARMLGGLRISDLTRQAAAEMLATVDGKAG